MKSKLESNIWKFYIAEFVGSFEFVSAIFVLYLLSNNLSMTQVLMLQSFFTIMIFLLEVPSGVIADTFGLKRTLALSQICVIFGFILYGIFSSFTTFMLAEFFIALGWALNSGTDSAFVYDTLKGVNKETTFKKVMGNVNALSMISVGISSAIGGYLASLFGYRYLFFIGASFFFLEFILILSLKEPKMYQDIEDVNYFKHLKEGVAYVYKHPIIKKYIIYLSLFSAFTYMLFFLIQPYFQIGGLSLTVIGLGVSGYFLFNALGYFCTDKITKLITDKNKLLVWLLFLVGTFFILLKFVNVWAGMLLIFVIMFLSAVKELVVEHEVNIHCVSSHRVTILSVKNMSKNLFYTLFGPVVGYLTDTFSLYISLMLMGATLLIFGVYVIFLFYASSKSSPARI